MRLLTSLKSPVIPSRLVRGAFVLVALVAAACVGRFDALYDLHPLRVALGFSAVQTAILFVFFRRLRRAEERRWAVEDRLELEEEERYEAERMGRLMEAIACSALGVELHVCAGDGSADRWAERVAAHARALDKLTGKKEPTAGTTPHAGGAPPPSPDARAQD